MTEVEQLHPAREPEQGEEKPAQPGRFLQLKPTFTVKKVRKAKKIKWRNRMAKCAMCQVTMGEKCS